MRRGRNRRIGGYGRAPQGARGLKYDASKFDGTSLTSRPARGAWIEMLVWTKGGTYQPSRPARGAWIEICMSSAVIQKLKVAPRKGRVD